MLCSVEIRFKRCYSPSFPLPRSQDVHYRTALVINPPKNAPPIRKFLDPSLDGDSKIVFSLEYHNILRLASITLAIKYDISEKA